MLNSLLATAATHGITVDGLTARARRYANLATRPAGVKRLELLREVLADAAAHGITVAVLAEQEQRFAKMAEQMRSLAAKACALRIAKEIQRMRRDLKRTIADAEALSRDRTV